MSAGRKNNSDKKDWNTPPKYITPIKQFFGGEIDLDPCSNEFSFVGAKENFIYPEKDGLTSKWNGKKIGGIIITGIESVNGCYKITIP